MPGPFNRFKLPSIRDIRKVVTGVLEEVSEVKEVPKSMIDKLTEADDDFKAASKLFKSTKLGSRRKRKK